MADFPFLTKAAPGSTQPLNMGTRAIWESKTARRDADHTPFHVPLVKENMDTNTISLCAFGHKGATYLLTYNTVMKAIFFNFQKRSL